MNWASTSMILALAFSGDKGFHDFVLRWPFQCVCSLGSIQQKPMNNWCPMWLVWGTHGWSIFIVKQSIFFLSIMYGAYCAQMFSCVWLFATAWTIACQVPLSMGFSRQEYWSVLLFPPPGDLFDPGIEPLSLKFFVLTGGFLGLPWWLSW